MGAEELGNFIIETLRSIKLDVSHQNDRIDKLVDSMTKLIEVDTETREIKSSVGRLYDRMEAVEGNQTTDGCPVHNRLVEVRAEQMKAYDVKIEQLEDKSKDIDERLKTIEDRPRKRMEVAIIEIVKYCTVGILGILAFKFGFSK